MFKLKHSWTDLQMRLRVRVHLNLNIIDLIHVKKGKHIFDIFKKYIKNYYTAIFFGFAGLVLFVHSVKSVHFVSLGFKILYQSHLKMNLKTRNGKIKVSLH